MNRDEIYPDGAPSPEQFAAFLDGELDAIGCVRVETWLKHHPDAAQEIDGQRKLMRLWQANRPAEPRDAVWSRVFDHIEAKVRPTSRRRVTVRRTIRFGAGIAAAVLAAVLLTHHFQAGVGHEPPPIASRPNVEPGDQEPIVLASQDDVSVVSVEPYWQDGGRVPAIGEGDVSMIVAAPLDREP